MRRENRVKPKKESYSISTRHNPSMKHIILCGMYPHGRNNSYADLITDKTMKHRPSVEANLQYRLVTFSLNKLTTYASVLVQIPQF